MDRRQFLFGIAASVGASLIGYMPKGMGAVATTIQSKLPKSNGASDRGAVGDFVPATATGTDNKAALQYALNSVMSTPGELTIEPGDYYLGASAVSNIAHLELGNQNGLQIKNIVINAYGVTLYPGKPGKTFAVMNCDNVVIKGLRILGYHGGALGSSRQFDHAMACMFNAWNVTFVDCYFAGAFGDQLYLGGENTGALTGYECRNIRLIGTTLKMRWGNATPSYSGGTTSRTAMAVIDCIGLEVDASNLIYGNVDLEPDVNGQHIVDCHISTRFSNGNVTAESVIGPTNMWVDEPIVSTGGTSIENAISAGTAAASPICSGNTLDGNQFLIGKITLSEHPVRIKSISRNRFESGLIRIASTGQDNLLVEGNTTTSHNSAAETYYKIAASTFISIAVAVKNTKVDGNTCTIASGYCVSTNGKGSDAGNNSFMNNRNLSASKLGSLSFLPVANSRATTESGVQK